MPHQIHAVSYNEALRLAKDIHNGFIASVLAQNANGIKQAQEELARLSDAADEALLEQEREKYHNYIDPIASRIDEAVSITQ